MLKRYAKSLGVLIMAAVFMTACTGLSPKTETIEDKIGFSYATINGIITTIDTLVLNRAIDKSKALDYYLDINDALTSLRLAETAIEGGIQRHTSGAPPQGRVDHRTPEKLQGYRSEAPTIHD